MGLSWRFFIRNNDVVSPAYVEIDEPIGWDGVEFTLTRSAINEGMESVYASELKFYDGDFTGYTILNACFDAKGSEANVDIEIRSYCNGVYEESIFGYLNFMVFEKEGNTINLQFEESSFSRRFKNRIDTVVNLDSGTGIDGGALTALSRKTIKLHSKEIKLLVESENSVLFDKDTFEYQSASPQQSPTLQYWADESHDISSGGSGCENKASTFYFQIQPDTEVVQDIGIVEWYGIPSGISTSQNPNGKIKAAGTVVFNLNIEACFFAWTSTQGGVTAKLCDCDDLFDESNFLLDHFDFQIEVKVGAQTQSNGISSYDRSICSEEFFGDLVGKNEDYFSGGGIMTDSFGRPFTAAQQTAWIKKNRFVQLEYEYTFTNVSVDEDIYIRLVCNVNGDFEKRIVETTVTYLAEGYLGQNTSIEISSTTVTDPTETTGYLVYEALNRTVESITGRTDAIRSNYFGRTDSVPKVYDETGCEALNLYTNGKSIRGLLKSDGTPYAINVSFQDIFNDLNQKRCLGYRIERIGGVDYVRIEPVEYFYNNESIITLEDVSNIRIEVAKNRLYNNLEIGYNKWEIENLNGIDEFNTKHNYTIPTTNIKQNLQVTTNYVAGGYAIEMTRRMQADEYPTSDWKYDDDIFIISLNRITVVSDLYSDASEEYAPGEVSERDELFSEVDNVISPETSYNLRFSPARSAMYWFKKFAPALLKANDKTLKFQSGTGNILLLTNMSLDDCRITSGELVENQDITSATSVFETLDRVALYEPIWINFEYPLTYSDFITIRDNSNKSITATCGVETYKGSIEELKFKPNIQNGMGEFKLLLGFCYLGEYDDSFSNAFDIGRC